MAASGTIGRGVGAREAAWLALALWGTAYVVFVGSAYTAEVWRPIQRKDADFILQFQAACSAAGLLASAALYLALRGVQRLRSRWRIPLIAAAVITIATVHSMVDTGFEVLFVDWYKPKAKVAPFLVSTAFNFLLLFWLHGLYAAGLGLIQFASALRQRELQLAEARALAHEAQLAALRFQLNPHFLFNTLNAVSTLVVTGRNPEAETMIGRLCEFLRVSLAADPQSATPLSEELGTVEAYLEIESVRFGERLQVEIVCPPALADALVPGLVLQPLVENAVKYAVAPARRPVTVRIEASVVDQDLVLTVEDDGDAAALPPDHSGTGVGLDNARRRLAALYGDRSGLEAGRRAGGGWRSALRLPLYAADPARRAA